MNSLIKRFRKNQTFETQPEIELLEVYIGRIKKTSNEIVNSPKNSRLNKAINISKSFKLLR